MAADGMNPVHFDVCSQVQLAYLEEIIDPELEGKYNIASAASELSNADGNANLTLSGPLSGYYDTTNEPVAIDKADNI